MNEQLKNIPYVKVYDEEGKLTNPITKSFLNTAPNRAKRREHLNLTPFKGNKKGISLTVVGGFKYERVSQFIPENFVPTSPTTFIIQPARTVNHYIAR